MLSVEKPRQIIGYVDGKPVAKIDLQVDAYSDLPGSGDTVDGYIVAPGSIAQVVQEGKFVTLAGDGDWYDSTGNVVETEGDT